MTRKRRNLTMADLGAEVCLHEVKLLGEDNVERCPFCGAVWDNAQSAWIGGSLDAEIHPIYQEGARRVAPHVPVEKEPFQPSPVLPEEDASRGQSGA